MRSPYMYAPSCRRETGGRRRFPLLCLFADRPNGKYGTSCADRTETHHVSPPPSKDIDTRCVLFCNRCHHLASGERIVSLRLRQDPSTAIFVFFTPASSVYFGKLTAKKVAGPKNQRPSLNHGLFPSRLVLRPPLLLLPPRTKRGKPN